MIQKVPGLQTGAVQLRRLYDWMGTLVHKPCGIFVLALFFFIEAIIICPAGPLLLLYCSEKPNRSFFFAFIATIFSVLGGIVAFYIGHSIWDLAGQKLVAMVTTPEKFEYLCGRYEANEAWAIILAGLTPLPYQVITLTAGFCRLSFLPFVGSCIIVRAARLFLIALVMFTWGKKVKEHINLYFNRLVIIFIGLLAITLFAIT